MANPAAAARQLDRAALLSRARYDFGDYGFRFDAALDDAFDIRPSRADGEEAFFFFWPRAFPPEAGFALFNFHCFLKKTGSLESFARGLGPSMADAPLEPWPLLGVEGLGYSRRIAMGELFQAAPQVIDFIGGSPDLEVTDSHLYFSHRHAHFYTGMLHSAEIDSGRMAQLRGQLLAGIGLV
ncbi:MAG TPA: hypothetical protein VN231_14760 [Allosphingosinicella sp.]|nr:hypothetical protein [Allosphingosinicella sp.]